MINSRISVFIVFSCIIISIRAYDPDALQDLCVADINHGTKLNGFPCKELSNITASDFFYDGISKPAVVNSLTGAAVTGANVEKIPGLNTLSVSLARIDYAPHGLNPPHTHPRATEVVYMLEGELEVGFITTTNKLFSKTIKVGEVFVFPRGLVHFQTNRGNSPASVLSAFNSQLPGTVSISKVLFAAEPPLPEDVLTRTFQVGTKMIDKIKERLSTKS